MTELKRITTPWSYSLAVEAGDFVFLAMHRGSGNNFTTQFHDTLAHMKKTLAEFDMTLADLAKINVWLKNVEDIRIYEKLFREYFEENKYPARMGATTEFVDDDCLVMIEGVAYHNKK